LADPPSARLQLSDQLFFARGFVSHTAQWIPILSDKKGD